MPIATVQLPNGKIADIEVPQGATPQEIESFVMSQPEFAQQPTAPQAPEAPQPAQEPQSLQERSQTVGSNFSRGAMKGLGNAAIGGVQAATDIGESAAKLIERIYFGDNVGQQNFGDRLAGAVKQRKAEQAQLPISEKAGIIAGEVAPYLAGGAATGAKVAVKTGSRMLGLAAGGAIGSAEQTALSPQEEAGLGNRAVETAKSAVTGAVVAPVLGKAIDITANIPNITKEAIKKIVGLDAQKAAKFADAGLSPTLANVSKFRPVSQIQNFLSATPAASSRIERVIQHQIDNVANKTIEIAGSKGGTIEEAGNIIGTGAKSYKDMLRKRSEKIYQDVYDQVPRDTKVNLTNTQNLLKEDVELQEAAINSDFLKRKLDRFNEISSPKEGGDNLTSLRRMKGFRSVVGQDLKSPSLTGSERSSLKKIYGSLSADLKDSVLSFARDKYGEDAAVKLYGRFNAADNVFKLQQDFIKKTITPLEDAKTPDKIYSIATSGIKNGGIQIDNVFKTLNKDQKSFIRGSLINRMGKAPQNLQDETNSVFSISKFRQDFNSLSDEAKKAIFEPEQLSAYNKLIKATSEIERTGRLGKINSATAQAVGWAGLTGAVISPYLSLPAAAGIAGGARVTAGMMTNPKFVNWLSSQPKVRNIKAIEDSISRLGAIAVSSDGKTRDEILEYMSQIIGGNEAQAADTENMTEEQIKAELIDANNQNMRLRLPPAYSQEEINNNPAKIKKRYYR